MQTDIAIVGGGLAGLSLARHLHREGVDFQLFEARARFGGRIFAAQHKTARFDLGPSWFWPGQRRMAALTQALGLTVFEQYAEGALLYETEAGEVLRDRGFSSMQGSFRLKGGMLALIESLCRDLPAERLHPNARATHASQAGGLRFADGRTCRAKQIVLALPPRLSAGLAYEPPLAPAQIRAMEMIPTWMAGHAKFVAIYDAPFWREQGLSGDAMSRRGPLVEIHDATDADNFGPGALFGFLGLPARARFDQEDALKEACLVQLGRIFGAAATMPEACYLQDWACDPFTATRADLAPLTHHPSYLMPTELKRLWSGALHLCTTEAAPEMGGYMEGALAASEAVAASLTQHKSG